MLSLRVAYVSLLCLVLSACAGLSRTDANLSKDTPLPAGKGSVVLTIALDSANTRGAWQELWVYTADGRRQYEVDLTALDSGTLVAYAALPPGDYRPDHLFSSYGFKVVQTFTATLPKSMHFTVVAGKDEDLGVLIRAADLEDMTETAYGWRPSDPVMLAAKKAYVAEHNPQLPTEEQIPWASAPYAFTDFLLANPAPNEPLKRLATGELIVPAHLGRALYRDTLGAWHIWDTGTYDIVNDASLLKDHRALIALDGGPVLVSDTAYGHWQQMPDQPADFTAANVGQLADGRVYVDGRQVFHTTDRTGHDSTQPAWVVYSADVDKGDWKLLHREDDSDVRLFAVDETNIYQYAPAGTLVVTDFRTGATRTGKLPGVFLRVLGNGVLVSSVQQKLLTRSLKDWISKDAGATWTQVVSPAYSDRLKGASILIPESPGAYLLLVSVLADGKPASDESAWTASFYETRDEGKSWTYAFPRGQDPACPAAYPTTLEFRYLGGKFWTLCENGAFWSYDPVTKAVVQERKTVMPADPAR